MTKLNILKKTSHFGLPTSVFRLFHNMTKLKFLKKTSYLGHRSSVFSLPTLIILFLLNSNAFANPYAKWTSNELTLDNGYIKRHISILNDRVLTRSLTIKDSDLNFNSKSEEFSFEIDGKKFTGLSGWKLISIVDAADKYQGKGAMLKLEGIGESAGISIDVTYLLYPDLPVIRKQLTVYNTSEKEIMLESLDVEKLIMSFNYIESVCYTNYGRQKRLGTYIGDWDDPILAVHSYQKNAGIIAGNESPGVLKRISYNTVGNDVNIGLTHTDDIYPFRKYIKSGEKWASPRTFVIPYCNNSDPWIIMNTTLSDFMRKHMGLRIYEYKNRPVLAANTWVPFRYSFNDTTILKASKAYAECGIQLSTIDVGWYVAQNNIGKDKSWDANIGDWIVDEKKFPNGLKPVFEKTRKMGLKSGLWISAGTGSKGYAKILEDHPEWTVKDQNNHPANLHSPNENFITFCFGTDWKDHSRDKILSLIRENNLSYVKLDLAVLTSAYINDIHKSGCYAKDHPYHKDREESFIVIYERIFEMFDELHAAFPDLYIDCTFEITGKMQLIDYAFCQHAEGNWLTNIEEPYPVGAFRIRNLNWWKSPAMPASAMLIGNMSMESPEFFQELKTLIGAFPIILGDPTKISAEKRAEIKQWADWMKSMQKKYDYDLFRQDLKGFGEPTEGSWDGWSRINTDTREGGIVGVFKQGSLDNERMVSVASLDQDKMYRISEAPGRKIIATMSGKDLVEKGFNVIMQKKYDSRIFEIEKISK